MRMPKERDLDQHRAQGSESTSEAARGARSATTSLRERHRAVGRDAGHAEEKFSSRVWVTPVKLGAQTGRPLCERGPGRGAPDRRLLRERRAPLRGQPERPARRHGQE